MFRGAWRVAVVLGLVLGGILVQVSPAGAVVRSQRHHLRASRAGSNTELRWNGALGPGRSVTGFIADPSNPFDPVTEGYPTSNPTTGFTPQNEGFAGVIIGTPTDGSPPVSLYCIDIRTFTYPGTGYALGTWSNANVPNVGYVARLLNEFYPKTNEPATLTDLNDKAAAVQAAIWFFTDRYVLSTSDPLHDAVAAIAAQIIREGPLIQPPPPSLAITPSNATGPAGSAVGPFTVTTDNLARHHGRSHQRHRTASQATVTATGGNMFANAAGTVPIPDGATVPSGQKIWVRSSGPSSVVLQATAQATVPSGNVYLYDGNTPGLDDAQKLILSQAATLTTTVQATAEFQPPGSLVVTKTIAGPAAGSQGQVVLHAACDDGVVRPDFVVPAASPAGASSHTYDDIPVGTMCTVTETANGSVVGTDVVVTGDGRQVTIPSGQSTKVKVTDTYHHVGSLLVRKTITGPGAGRQGPITIHTVCNGTALTPDFAIAAGAPAGDQTRQYDHISVPATCTVTETADGHNTVVSAIVGGSGQKVSVPTGDVAVADVSDTYALLPGQLEVTKTIAGPLAGQQGTVVIHTVCNGAALTPDFVIPAGTAAGVQSHTYSDVPTPASCVVAETSDGHTSAVSVVSSGSPQTISVPVGGAGAAHLTDTYGAVPGSLLITKTIAGRLAGRQGPVTIHVTCNGTALSPDFLIAAGAPAGSVSHSFDGIPAGSRCTVTETSDGASATVIASVAGNDQTVTIPAGKVVPVNIMDVYEGTLGSLKVTKTITGPAAHLHGRIAILVRCGGVLKDGTFLIGAKTGPGSVSRYFDGLPAGSRCTVTETDIGRTSKVIVGAKGRRSKLTIPAAGRAIAHIIDSFYRRRPVPSGRG